MANCDRKNLSREVAEIASKHKKWGKCNIEDVQIEILTSETC